MLKSGGQLRPVGAVELFQRVIEMRAHGGKTDVQQSGNFFITQSFADQINHLLLPGGEQRRFIPFR